MRVRVDDTSVKPNIVGDDVIEAPGFTYKVLLFYNKIKVKWRLLFYAKNRSDSYAFKKKSKSIY